MNKKTKVLDKIFTTGVLLSALTVGHGECYAQKTESSPASAAEAATAVTDYRKQALAALGNFRQLFRPIDNIGLEHTVERKKGDKWVLAERNLLQYDFQKGFFRKRTLHPFNDDDKEENRRVLLYRETAWDGEKSTVLERVFGYTKEMLFIENPSVSGTMDASIYGSEVSLFSWFPLFFRGRTVDRTHGGTMLGIVGGLKEEDFDVQSEPGKLKIFSKDSGIRLVIDVKTGLLLEKTILAFGEDGFSEKSREEKKITIAKSIIKDGWQIPIEYTFIGKDDAGKIIYEERVKIKPESIVINAPPARFDLSVDLPVGMKVDDHIAKISYRVTDFDVKNRNKKLKEKLDLLLKDAEKIEEVKK